MDQNNQANECTWGVCSIRNLHAVLSIYLYCERTLKTTKLFTSSKVVLKSKGKVGRRMWSVLLSLRWKKKKEKR